ncbi:MAG: NAD(P)-dependent oxidoreductase [Planctomycetota bacterium]|nr:NAD(P)-dependent oxidoreductase [Planctomycetota bacterium]
MNVLVIGAAGYVGTILRPALEQHHTCRFFDIVPVPDAEGRCMVGSINNDKDLRDAAHRMDAVLFLAMGAKPGHVARSELITSSFEVNVCGYYRTLLAGVRAGATRFILASTLSVYYPLTNPLRRPLTEETPPDAIMEPYGFSKRVAEFTNEAFAAKYPKCTFLALRLMWPRSEKDWPGNEYTPGQYWYPQGPEDLRRLFLAALDFDTPGAHAVQTTGDLGNDVYPNTKATQLLGWRPESR